MINRALEKAQQKVESHNYEIRKNLLKFDDVMNDQRKVIYKERNEILSSQNLEETLIDMIFDSVSATVNKYIPIKSLSEDWDLENLIKDCHKIFNINITKEAILGQEVLDNNKIVDFIDSKVNELYTEKKEKYGFEVMHEAIRYMLIIVLDQLWKEHLHQLDHLRQGISLRAYGQKDPLNEYKKEAFNLFTALLDNWGELAVNKICFIHIDNQHNNLEAVSLKSRPLQKMHKTRQDPAFNLVNSGQAIESKIETKKNYISPEKRIAEDPQTWGRISRNESCPCGSGKKYKNCHG
jgi:preprotein translocase subunit SecA